MIRVSSLKLGFHSSRRVLPKRRILELRNPPESLGSLGKPSGSLRILEHLGPSIELNPTKGATMRITYNVCYTLFWAFFVAFWGWQSGAIAPLVASELPESQLGIEGNVSNSSLPNVVIIYADDLGFGDLSTLNPKAAYKTPRLDSMAGPCSHNSYQCFGLKLIEQTRQFLASNQINLFKSIIGMLLHIAKGIEIARISQRIEVQNMMPMCDKTAHKVRADKSRTAGH